MRKLKFIFLGLIILFLTLFLIIKYQQIQRQRYIDKSQREQKEGDKIYAEKVLEERRKDPLFDFIPLETQEFILVPTLDVRYEYTVVARIEDKQKAKQAFLNWVKDRNLDISHLNIIYQ